jgi:hypothetical protein
MQAITGKVHGLRRVGIIEAGKNILNRLQQVRPYPAAVVAFIKSLQPMFKTPNR